MNTNKEKHDNNTKPEKKNVFKLYRWRKEWVRPYESVYSILRNFCKVNVFQGSYAMKVLEVRGYYSTGLPVPKIMMFSKAIQNEYNYEHLYDVLLPEWYKKQITPVTSLDIPVFSDVVRPTIFYCPKCAKENYHSFLFQFYHVKDCPFHHIPLIETSWYYTPQDSITYWKSDNYTDVRSDILPCERQLANDYCQNNYNTDLRYVIPISSLDDSKHGNYSHMHQTFCVNNGASYSFQIQKSELNFKEMKLKFIDWFNSQTIPTDLCNPKHVWKIHNSTMYMFSDETSIANYLEHLLYYLFYDFLKEYDLSSEESFAKIGAVYDGRRVLQTNEIFELKISYLWAIISCSNPFYSLNNTWITKPHSSDIQNTRHIYNGVHLSYLRGYDIKYSAYIPKVDGTIIMMRILSDLFKSVWNQVLSIVKRDGQFSAFHGWKLIHVPEYYICINDTDNFYTVLRYDNMPK